MKKNILFLWILTIPQIGCTQNNSFDFVSSLKKNEKHIKKDADKNSETVYLGDIRGTDGIALYHIVSNYSFVYATSHGFSNIYFLDLDYRIIRHYELGNPDELPFKLLDNELYFYYLDKDGKKKVFISKIGLSPPKIICVAPDNCY